MNSNYRQAIILFDLLSQNTPLTYEHFIDILEVTKRTIRQDIKMINDSYKNELQIEFKKNVGFFVVASEENIKKIIDEMRAHYTDIFDTNLKSPRNYQIILMLLFKADDYVKVDQLTSMLFVNKRTITNILMNVRKLLQPYQLQLLTRPHYGMYISGNETNYRLCNEKVVFDNIYQCEDDTPIGNSLPNINETEFKTIEQIVINYFIDNSIEIDQLSSFRLTIMILTSYYRIIKKHEVEYNEQQLQFLSHLKKKINISDLISQLEIALDLKYSENEKDWLLVYTLINSLNFIETYYDYIIDHDSQQIVSGVYNLLYDLSIINEANYSYYQSYIQANSLRLYITALFGIYDNCYGASSVKAITQSALSNAIAQKIITYVEEQMNFRFGITSLFDTSHLIYSMIRSVNNVGRKVNIAVYTPWGKINSNSLKRRIENSWLEVINKIDIISYNDLFGKKIDNYDYLLYCNCKLASTLYDKKIKTILVNYLFTEEDSSNFYEKVVVPSRIYHRAFGKIYKEDYIKNYKFTGLANLKKQLKQFTKEKCIIEQIGNLRIDLCNFYYGDLTIVVFCKNTEQAFSKLFFLEYYARYNEQKFNRIFFHCISLDYDMIKLKTAEKVIRNIVVYTLTSSVVANNPYIDFYDYYVFNAHNPISSIKEKL